MCFYWFVIKLYNFNRLASAHVQAQRFYWFYTKVYNFYRHYFCSFSFL